MKADDLLAHLDRIRHAGTPDEVGARLAAATAGFGIDRALCGLVPLPSTPPAEARRAIFFGN